MEITWYGHSCFRLTERGSATVVTDPFDSRYAGYEPLKLRADIVTISHDSPGHNFTAGVKGVSHVLDCPGEYEIGGVFITGVQTNGFGKKNEEELRNTLYVFDYNGITVAHLGDLSHVPSQTEIEALGTVHVALVPVGGGGGLNSDRAAEVISMIVPNFVIPMHYATPDTGDTAKKMDTLSKFIKEMGLSEVQPQPSLKITSAANLPEETKVIVLDYQRSV